MANLANGERPIETAKENLGNTIWHQKRLMQKQNPWHAWSPPHASVAHACGITESQGKRSGRDQGVKKRCTGKMLLICCTVCRFELCQSQKLSHWFLFNQRTTRKMFTLQSHDFHRFYQVFVLSSQALIRDNNGKNHSMLLLMAEIWLTTWDVWNPINNGINHQPLNWWNRRIGPPSTVQLFNPFHHQHLSTKARTRCTSQTAAPCVGLCHGLTVMPWV